jgi:hypothetical protein
MGEHDAAQAVILIRALTDLRDNTISQMTWLERHGSQLDAVALRRDVNEAQAHITRLQRRYVGREEPPRASVDSTGPVGVAGQMGRI